MIIFTGLGADLLWYIFFLLQKSNPWSFIYFKKKKKEMRYEIEKNLIS